MGRKSTIKTLPSPIQAAVHDALGREATIDQIVHLLGKLGHDRSRSAVGRYSASYRAMADRQRDIVTLGQAYGKEFGEDGNNDTRLMGQLMTTLATSVIIPLVSGETIDISALDLKLLTDAVKNTTQTAKIEDDRRRAIRKDAFEEASKAAQTEARAQGASDEVIEAIKTRLLGLKA